MPVGRPAQRPTGIETLECMRMLLLTSALIGYAIQASNGRIGSVADFLFDDATWHVRWLVVATGSWLTGRRLVLVHLPLIDHVDHGRRVLIVRLTRAEVDASPDILLDEPVSRQIEYGLHGFSDGDPEQGHPRYVAGLWGGMGVCVSKARLEEETAMHKTPRGGGTSDQGDPHLRSVSAVIGSHVRATDGYIGHVEDLRVDNVAWQVRCLVVDTRDWWPGRRVMVLPTVVESISWARQEVVLDVSRQSVRNMIWSADDVVDQADEDRLPGRARAGPDRRIA